MKKLISVLLAVVMLISVFTVSVSAKEPLNYLLLGDSIARGAGVLNPDEACYGLMVANTNGYNYKNDGIDGYTSEMLLKLLDDEAVMNDVENADIISLSIGGNDFLKANIASLLIGAEITHDYQTFYEIRDEFYDNFDKIIRKIQKANPDVLILMQTIYNMRSDLLKGVNQIGSDLLNECYNRYLEENPGAYVLVDVGSVLTGRKDCLAADTIHPNGTGNIEIARLVLQALKEQGLGMETEPVILIEPIEQVGFGFAYVIRVAKYYINYFLTH